MSKSAKVISLFLLLTYFYGFIAFKNIPLGNTIHLAILAIGTILGFGKKKEFKAYFIAIIFALILNAISSLYYRGQGLFTSFKAAFYILDIFFFYFLVYINISVRKLEKAMLYLTLGAAFCYFFQQIMFPKIYFIASSYDWILSSKTAWRFIQIHGQSLLSLGVFYGLNKFLTKKESKYIILIIICFIAVLMRGFRIMLFSMVVSSMYLIYAHNKKLFTVKNLLTFVGILVFLAISYFIPPVQEALNHMVERQSGGETLDNEDYARTIQLVYFFNDHFKSNIEYFFGSGLVGDSPYGKYVMDLREEGINLADWGLLGLSWIGGIPLVLCIIGYMIKAIRTKVPKPYKYIGAWFIYLLIISITHPEAYQQSSMLVHALLLYMLTRIKYEKRRFSLTQRRN